jgi:hypothetical protein
MDIKACASWSVTGLPPATFLWVVTRCRRRRHQDVIAINQDVTPQGRVVVEGDSTVWARHLTGGEPGAFILPAARCD